MIKLGTAGKMGLSYEKAFEILKKNHLNALEVEFVYGVRITNAQAKHINTLAKKFDITLSVHAPYYINLASPEPDKLAASHQRILDSCERAHHLGAVCVVFHPGFYQERNPENVYSIIKKEIMTLQKTIRSKKWNTTLAPETTGKISQFGSLDELLGLRKETGCGICVDFSHILARSNGKITFAEILDKLEGIEHIHAHFSGIEYTDKGEKKHVKITKKFAHPLFQALLKKNKNATIVIESPEQLKDAIICRNIIRSSTGRTRILK